MVANKSKAQEEKESVTINRSMFNVLTQASREVIKDVDIKLIIQALEETYLDQAIPDVARKQALELLERAKYDEPMLPTESVGSLCS